MTTTTTTTAPAPATALRRSETRKRPPGKTLRTALRYAVLIIVAAIIVLPLVWIFFTSFKTDADAIQDATNPFPNPFTIEAYQTLTNGQYPIFRWFLNSMTAGLIQTALILITASMGAYALARLQFRGKNVVFAAIVLTLFVPPIIFLIPNYLIVQGFGWLDTVWAITIPGAAGAFGIFFLRQFFIGLPAEIEEAARIDGAGDWRIFFQIILPLSRPAIATLAVLSFLANWNDFLWPIYVLLSSDTYTLQPGLSVLRGAYSTHYAVVMAGAVVAAVPVLILFTIAQRHVVDSVASAGLKG